MSLSVSTFTDAEVKHSAFRLASIADVSSPDTRESAGVRLLERVQSEANGFDADALLEGIREWVAEGNDADDYGVNDLPDSVRDSISEGADSCVQIYTYQLWQEFVDLCLWQEDPRDFISDDLGDDLTKVASMAQYHVAERLLGTLLAERAVLLHEANPVDEHAHDDAENDVIHLEDAGRDYDALERHLRVEHGVPTMGQDLDTLDGLHRTLDHSDLADT